ncbi:glycosyltransferase [Hoeflea sp.]|uniref:glycosyltransferase n=1 Tax=Hoeflea sp. TaxID=1940281 RepID=UPI003A8CA90B
MSLRYSIIVPVYNNPADLRNCIESLKALDYPARDYEIIVVDNNSTDGTAAVATELGVTCLSETRFQSSYAARNTGIKAARGTFIAFTDSDCVADKGWLKAIDAVSDDEAAGCFAGEILSVKPTTTVERFSDKIGLLRQKGPLSGWHFKPYAQTANAVYRKSVFDQIGLFDPTTKSGGDAAIAWRMLDKTAYTIRFVPEAIVYHHHRTSVPDLYAQFRRYGGGKMSWALSQPDYPPPAIAALEKDIVATFVKHLELLETHSVAEDVLFSGLKAATQAAQLSGYLQDLLRYTTNGAALDKAPEIARERAPTCDICGSHSFMPGPGERLANGRPPQCRECGSLERHRVIHNFILELDRSLTSCINCVSFREKIPNGSGVFQRYFHFENFNENYTGISLDSKLIICTNLFSPTEINEWHLSIERVLQHISEDGILVLINEFGIEYAKKLDRFLYDALPNTHHEVNYVADHATGALLSTLIVSGPENFASNSLLPQLRRSALKMNKLR